MLNFPKNQFVPKTKEERNSVDCTDTQNATRFSTQLLADPAQNHKLPFIPCNYRIFPISQKHSTFSGMPYGKIGTVSSAACGPLAVEYALRLMGFPVSLEEILQECVEKGYRGYVYDDSNNIIDGAGTENVLFSNLAQELSGSIREIMVALSKGPVTLLMDNSIYHDDSSRKGNHFITLVGIDENENAILMDGNLIVTHSEEALVIKNFRKILPGIKGAWGWEHSKVKGYLS